MASRSEADLAQDVCAAWQKSLADYKRLYPDDPQPILTCTHRSNAEQNALYAQGRTRPGKIVTNAKGGQSNHNQYPSPAFDIAFKDASGNIHWDMALFKQFALIAKRCGLAWGGDWIRFKDLPHFERKGVS
jgi:peptidoglycan L-alanyl-D-glutamate endopeptidase CwlK